jgi:hypothetical protein
MLEAMFWIVEVFQCSKTISMSRDGPRLCKGALGLVNESGLSER